MPCAGMGLCVPGREPANLRACCVWGCNHACAGARGAWVLRGGRGQASVYTHACLSSVWRCERAHAQSRVGRRGDRCQELVSPEQVRTT